VLTLAVHESCARCVIFHFVNNVIIIEFYSKKNFPPGEWKNEPDLCYWERRLPCLALRDMAMGIWKGFVGIEEGHPFYGLSIEELLKHDDAMEIFFAIHGGITMAGRLPPKYKEYAKNYWWIGLETSHGADLMPFLKLDTSDPDMAKMLSNQVYKDIHFIRRETNKLANHLVKLK